jgi:hypothetical protein
MLWYKGWLETRWLALLLIGPYAAFLLFAAVRQPVFHQTPPPAQAVVILRSMEMTYFVATLAIVLAGTGVNPQRTLYRWSENLQGKTLFTLSLPVTRVRLLAVRAGLGWLEMAGGIGVICAGTWAAFDAIRSTVAPLEMFKYASALILSATGVYALGVLLFTFMTDRVLIWVAVMALIPGLQQWRVPISADVRWSLSGVSGGAAFAMPWFVMGVSVACAPFLLAAALKIVRTQDY